LKAGNISLHPSLSDDPKIVNLPPETGSKLARNKKPLTRNLCKWLTCFAPQPGLEPMRALRNAPVEHFSEAVSLQGRRSSHSNKKTGL